jgi:hypothetical protein
MTAMTLSVPILLFAVAGCQSTPDARRPLSAGANPDSYVRSALREATLAYERTGREMTLAGSGSPFPFSADVPACLVGLLTSSPRYADALRRVAGDDGVSFTERYIAGFCLHFQIVQTWRFRISFEGLSTDDGFSRVTVSSSER